MRYVSPLIAAGLMLLTGFVLFAALGKDPLAAFYAFSLAPISNVNGLAELILKASPLVLIAIGMLAGGAAAGIAGISEVAGPLGQLLPTVSPGYGFAAIIVAFVGRLNPVGILLAGLLMSLHYLGGDAAQISMGLPAATSSLFQGALLFFLLGADVFITYRVRLVRSPKAPRQEAVA